MKKGNLTRKQAIATVGQETIDKLDSINCEPTSRLQTDGDNSVEWSASIEAIDSKGPCVVTVYYYTTPEEAQEEDMSSVDWHIHGYEIV